MLMQAIDNYLRLRRTAGFQLRDTEVLLREFARFATERDEIHIKTDTAIAWAGRATSPRQRARRLSTLILFARFIRAEDAEHQVPPKGVFAHHPQGAPSTPHLHTLPNRRSPRGSQETAAGGVLEVAYVLHAVWADSGVRIADL